MNLPALGNDGLFNKILICYMYVGTFAEIVGSSVTIKLSQQKGAYLLPEEGGIDAVVLMFYIRVYGQ